MKGKIIICSAMAFILSCSSDDGDSGPSSCVGGTVTIGSQIWQKCNSDAVPLKGIHKCYDNLESNCKKYGGLYDWEAANSVCPPDFHLPTKEDRDALIAYIQEDKNCTNCYAKHLKTREFGGLDSYGFSALLGGSGYSGGNFSDVGYYGDWWSASEYSNSNWSAYYLGMSHGTDNAALDYFPKYFLFSVRCVGVASD